MRWRIERPLYQHKPFVQGVDGSQSTGDGSMPLTLRQEPSGHKI